MANKTGDKELFHPTSEIKKTVDECVNP